jgi:hypothetical protein
MATRRPRLWSITTACLLLVGGGPGRALASCSLVKLDGMLTSEPGTPKPEAGTLPWTFPAINVPPSSPLASWGAP